MATTPPSFILEQTSKTKLNSVTCRLGLCVRSGNSDRIRCRTRNCSDQALRSFHRQKNHTFTAARQVQITVGPCAARSGSLLAGAVR
jgi:hypothetical protein